MTDSDHLPLVEELDPAPDVMDVTRALSSLPRLLVLDSALQRDRMGRYSFVMADPLQAWQHLAARFGEDPFTEMERALGPWRCESLPGLPPFQGGVAGLMGYELGGCFERIRAARHDEFQLPVLAAGLYDRVIVWDHATGRAWIVSQGWPEVDRVRRLDRAAHRIREVRELLARPIDVAPRVGAGDANCRLPAIASQFPIAGVPGLTSTFTRDDYLRAIERVIDYIHAGDIFQANLSHRLLYPARVAPSALFERLRRVNPAPFAGLMQWDDWAVVSASPERFLRVENNEVETRPIKGTRRRKRGPEADLFTRDELRESEKDQSENVMIVDLLRNDLSRVCEAGSIRVPQLCHVETYETVQHLVSEVRGRLRPDQTLWDLFRAAWPGGSITGAPKVRAMEIIAELEPTVRGAYCGSLFYAGANGQADSNLLIRTFVQRSGWLQCGVGGGIVADSNPEAEYEETLVKAAGMVRALQ